MLNIPGRVHINLDLLGENKIFKLFLQQFTKLDSQVLKANKKVFRSGQCSFGKVAKLRGQITTAVKEYRSNLSGSFVLIFCIFVSYFVLERIG